MSLIDTEQVQARMALVDEHVRCENRHDLEAVMATFGADARFDDEPWGDHRTDRAGVRSYYTDLLRALPDLVIEVIHRHAARDSIVLEVVIGGTHRGAWRGLPAAGSGFPCAVCTRSTPLTGWQASGSTMTARRCSSSWASFTSP